MHEPIKNVGKVFKALEKYFDIRTGKMKVKARPVLVIGYEHSYTSPLHIDYELLMISKISKHFPDENYDIPLAGSDRISLNLNADSHLRSHKVTWINAKQMKLEQPISNLKYVHPHIFRKAILKNEEWNTSRNEMALKDFK